jgi:hypothetical protein
MAGYTLPNTLFGSPNFGIPTGTANTTDQAIAQIALNLSALNSYEAALTPGLPAAGPSTGTVATAGPAAVVGAAAQGVTATIVGNDLAGTVTVTGATGGNTGTYVTVAFGGRTGVAAPSGVLVSAQSSAAAAAGTPSVTGLSATGFSVLVTPKGATGGLVWSYLVVG